MPNSPIATNTAARTSGIERATTAPARMPRLSRLTPRTMATASHSASMKSSTACDTVTGWLAMSVGSMPTGRFAVIWVIACATLRPSVRTSPPLRMAIASPMPSRPFTRNFGWAGSAGPRHTCAMSARRMIRPLATKLTARRSCSDWNAPETRTSIFSSPVCTMPAGVTIFCDCSAAISAERSSLRPANCPVENSTYTRSSWAPSTSTFEISGTARSCLRTSST